MVMISLQIQYENKNRFYYCNESTTSKREIPNWYFLPLLEYNVHQKISPSFPWNNGHNLEPEAHYHVTEFPTRKKELNQRKDKLIFTQ